jgi:glycosyltransferase involved in cell wall biosynthesis
MKFAAPDVSVILPVYNGAEWVAETLDSLKRQTFQNYEVIMIDDGSTDGSIDAIKPYLKDPRFSLMTRRNAGIPRTRNRALSMSKAPFVCFIDQDDLYKVDKLGRQIQYLTENPDAAAVHSAVERLDVENNSIEVRDDLKETEGNLFDFLLDTGYAMPLLSVMARRKAVEATGLFDENLFGTDDYDWLLRLSRQGRFGYISQPLVIQRFRRGTAGQSEAMYADKILHAQKIKKLWPEKKSLARRYAHRAHYLYGSYLLNAGRRREALPHLRLAWKLNWLDWRAAIKLFFSFFKKPKEPQ